jgi:hypothetical protein
MSDVRPNTKQTGRNHPSRALSIDRTQRGINWGGLRESVFRCVAIRSEIAILPADTGAPTTAAYETPRISTNTSHMNLPLCHIFATNRPPTWRNLSGSYACNAVRNYERLFLHGKCRFEIALRCLDRLMT